MLYKQKLQQAQLKKKKKKRKQVFFCMYIHTRFNIPRSFSPQFYKVVIYMDHDKKVMVLVNTVVCVYT